VQAGINLTGWSLIEATGVSANASTIVGRGTDPAGRMEAWIISFPTTSSTPTLPPSTTPFPNLQTAFFNSLINTQMSGSTPAVIPIQLMIAQSAPSLANKILTSFGIELETLVGNVAQRNARAIEYVADNKTVNDSIVDLLTTRAATKLYGPVGEVAADIVLNIKDILGEIDDFKKGNYYEGTLNIINQVSSLLLTYLPYGGTSADILNVAGAVATAYVYGFFCNNC
jgi:hypothetical protein